MKIKHISSVNVFLLISLLLYVDGLISFFPPVFSVVIHIKMMQKVFFYKTIIQQILPLILYNYIYIM